MLKRYGTSPGGSSRFALTRPTPGVCRARHRSVLVRRRRTAVECHDFGPAEESGQSVPVRSGMLKSCGCDAMTGAGGSFLGWGSESRERNGLGRSASGRCAPVSKSSRNIFEGRKTRLSGTNRVGVDQRPVSSWIRMIATNDAMDATNLELRRLRYDDRLSGHFRAADAKEPPNQPVAGLTAASPNAPLYMRQECDAGLSIR